MEKEITISPDFLQRWPTMQLGCLYCKVKTVDQNSALNQKMDMLQNLIESIFEVEELNQLPAIFHSRKAYRTFGKDPARYRLSAEALLRRITKGIDIYRINNVVDIVNMVSIQTGFSIGGYDCNLIDGNISLGLGRPEDIYEGIGRGSLNIENLPVLRDNIGPFGSPTSDSTRTSVSLNTSSFLMIVFGFGANEKMKKTLSIATKLLEEYAEASSFESLIINE